jgi:hypothetical protein
MNKDKFSKDYSKWEKSNQIERGKQANGDIDTKPISKLSEKQKRNSTKGLENGNT